MKKNQHLTHNTISHPKMQTTAHLMMVRPAHFGFNEETAVNNSFQTRDNSLTVSEIQVKAQAEFDGFVHKLRSKGVHVHVMENKTGLIKPDEVFPNNWISFHQNATIFTYPMFAKVRRIERSYHYIDELSKSFKLKKHLHLEQSEDEEQFLEGTGSMIFDRQNDIVYACLSPRTNETLLDEFCATTGYKKIVFDSVDGTGAPIYHTNVMMALGEDFVVICTDTIKNQAQKENILQQFKRTHKDIIEISFDQMLNFAGNMLQVRNDNGKTFLVMSEQAYASLNGNQIKHIEKYTEILYSNIKTIETYGGGSARCMMAEIFLEPKNK
jgi:hypothetical protein